MAGSKRVTVVVDEYLTDLVHRELSKDHLQGNMYILRRWLEAIHNDVYLSQVTAADMKHFFYGGVINGRMYRGIGVMQNGEKVAGSTWNAYRRLMEKFCKDIGRGDLMTRKVVPLKKVAKKAKFRITEDQMEYLIDSAPDLFEAAMLAICVDYGPRAGEVRRLLIGDYVRTQGVINITMTKSRTHEVIVRTHPVTPDCRRRIELWLDEYAKHFRMTKEQLLVNGREWRLFPRRRMTGAAYDKVTGKRLRGRVDIKPHLPYMHIWLVVQRGLGRLGYTEAQIKGNGIHVTRRSTARALRDATNDTRQATALLGHSSERTTEIYLGIDRDTERVNDGLLDGGWRGARAAQVGATVTPIKEVGGGTA